MPAGPAGPRLAPFELLLDAAGLWGGFLGPSPGCWRAVAGSVVSLRRAGAPAGYLSVGRIGELRHAAAGTVVVSTYPWARVGA